MTKIIGLTGGIGSGKTTIANYLIKVGIPVYIADDEAHKIFKDEDVIEQLKQLFGNDILTQDGIDKKEIAKQVFENSDLLNKLNQIIHPRVKKNFEEWCHKNTAHAFVVKEAAILFESGSYKDCDIIITVVAPLETRIKRVMLRDNSSKETILNRINNQWSDEMRIEKSDFVIQNINENDTIVKVNEILKKLNILQ